MVSYHSIESAFTMDPLREKQKRGEERLHSPVF